MHPKQLAEVSGKRTSLVGTKFKTFRKLIMNSQTGINPSMDSRSVLDSDIESKNDHDQKPMIEWEQQEKDSSYF